MKKHFMLIARFAAGVLLFVILWYGLSRQYSHHHRIRVHESGASATVSEPVRFLERLKVASYNIAHGRGGESNADNRGHGSKEALLAHLKRIAEQIRRESPDIMVLNETDFDSAWSYNVNQARYIAEKCGYPHILEQINMDVNFPFYRLCFGNAVLSRYPLKNAQFLNFPPRSGWEDFFAGNHDGVFCEARTPFGPVGIFAIHLEYRSETVRQACVRMIAETGSKYSFPVIALGDFNSTLPGLPGAKQAKKEKNAMYYLLGEGGFTADSPLDKIGPEHYTFPSEKPATLIDWITGKGIRSFSGAKNIKSRLSDHLMVTAEVEF